MEREELKQPVNVIHKGSDARYDVTIWSESLETRIENYLY